MFKDNKKAKELSQEAKELLQEADSGFLESSCQLNENLQAYIALRNEVTQKTLKEFDDAYSQIQNVELSKEKITIEADKLENIDYEFQNTLEEVQPVHVEEVKSGAFGAFFKAGIFAVIAFAVAVIGGILASGSNIYLDKVPEPSQINELLTWFGNLADPGNGDANKGALLLGGVIALIVFLIAFTKMNARASENLKKAQKAHELADEVHQKKMQQAQKSMSLSEYSLALAQMLKTVQIYMDEFNAIMRRIIHVEGTDFSEYSEKSKKDINMAVTIQRRINDIITTNVIAEDGEITPETRKALEECEECIKQHTDVSA
jgi:hypothetical protein